MTELGYGEWTAPVRRQFSCLGTPGLPHDHVGWSCTWDDKLMQWATADGNPEPCWVCGNPLPRRN